MSCIPKFQVIYQQTAITKMSQLPADALALNFNYRHRLYSHKYWLVHISSSNAGCSQATDTQLQLSLVHPFPLAYIAAGKMGEEKGPFSTWRQCSYINITSCESLALNSLLLMLRELLVFLRVTQSPFCGYSSPFLMRFNSGECSQPPNQCSWRMDSRSATQYIHFYPPPHSQLQLNILIYVLCLF